MSPASKAKSKDKKAGKDPQKASVKPSGLVNMGTGTPVSGYNPLLGKFHTIETAAYSSLQVNGRFRNIDEDDYSGSSGGNGMEYDTLSNNGSWSGESEDHKDKTNPLRQEAAAAPDSDKREKIRQKNERKHQRQKERRALELHERCNGFLMSRKLESLAQQLVSMGFSQERATMALISNEGKMEESVSWLFEGAGEEAVDTLNKEHLNLDAGNLKIDISDELARIADMEIRYKCSRQEVERAIVTCEGDLDKATDTLRVQKQVSLSSPSPKPDETGDPPTLTNDKLSLPNSSQNSLRLLQPKPMPSTLLQQQKRDDKDFNYTKAAVATNGVIVVPSEPGSKNVQVLRKPQSKVEWTKSQQPQQIVTPVDKRNQQQQQQVSSYSLSSPLQVVQAPPAKAEARYTALGSEIKNLQLGLVKEPVVVMQRPQSANAKQVSATSISSSSSSQPNNAVASSGGWYPNHVELVKPNGGLHSGLSPHHIVPSTRNNNLSSSNQLFSQLHYQQQYQHPQYVSNNGMMMGNGMWNRMGGGSNTTTTTTTTTPTLAVASSLGLFTGMGSNGSSGSSSPVDWKTGGSMVELDYANIDWSLDRSSRPNSGMWNAHGYDAYTQGLNARTATTMRPLANNMSSNVQDGGDVASSSSSGETSAAGGAREWSSPFEEKDIFSLPRQFVFSPSL